MNRIFSPSFWVQLFISTFMTMIMIYLIKMIATKFNVPVVKQVSEGI